MEQNNKIPLRQFYRNIDEYILNQAHDEAILYAKFLLEKYPKNFNAFQLLGKAFLDAQKYDLALLCFEKVLAIEPDDFVSHIGTSLIAESFGNLEQALQSMQRAYEIQPSNESLQSEVIRLIRAKDGFAPEKLRLTRGALIKMYSRSKLSEQAIAEARLGIHESPDRVDYKIKLTEMLFIDGKQEEAFEQSLKILKALPYCKPILEMLYSEFSKIGSEDADFYKSRLSELDPYYVFMRPETASVNDIPDVAIMIEAGDFPQPHIEDLKVFIHDTWQKDADVSIPVQSEPGDWQSVVDLAVENEGIGAPLSANFEQLVQPDADSIAESAGGTERASKREKFLSKLSASKDDHEKSDEIPDWILSYGNLEPSTEVQPEDSDQEEIVFPLEEHGFEEDGMTDHASPVHPSVKDGELDDDTRTWESEDPEAVSLHETQHKLNLEDTQKIKIVKQNPEEALRQLDSAFKNNDPEFAMQCIETLLAKEYKLVQLTSLLEEFLAEHPGEIELWLYLVRIFRKLGMNEKALNGLENAQLNISI